MRTGKIACLLAGLLAMDGQALLEARYQRFRRIGKEREA